MKKPLKKLSLVDRVIMLVESARQKAATAANLAQVYTNYEIGRQIVEEEQQGKSRAGYGRSTRSFPTIGRNCRPSRTSGRRRIISATSTPRARDAL